MPMLRTLASTATVTALAAAVLASPTSAAVSGKRPPVPKVLMNSSLGIPAYECYGIGQFARIGTHTLQKVDSTYVTIRKSGISLPVSSSEICGYMGSGRYTVEFRITWRYQRLVNGTVPVKKLNPALTMLGGYLGLPVAMTCTQAYGPLPPSAAEQGQFFYCGPADPELSGLTVEDLNEYTLVWTTSGLPAGAKLYRPTGVPGASGDQKYTDMYVTIPAGEAMPPSFTINGGLTVDDVLNLLGIIIPVQVVVGRKPAKIWKWSGPIRSTVTRSISVSVR